jgi:hypothetical protein
MTGTAQGTTLPRDCCAPVQSSPAVRGPDSRFYRKNQKFFRQPCGDLPNDGPSRRNLPGSPSALSFPLISFV